MMPQGAPAGHQHEKEIKMTRALKTSGMVLAAVLVMSAAATSTAFAGKFKSESAPVTITGSQVEANVITTTAGTVKCTTATYAGTVAVTETSEIELQPSFSGCTAFGFPAHIHASCKVKGKISINTTTGEVDFVCLVGQKITVTATTSSVNSTLKCTLEIPAQTNVGTVTYSNTGAGATREILVSLNLSGINYTHTKGSGLGACTSGSSSTGTYKGSVQLTGENAGGTHVGIFEA
jgi:hypothetical protein